MHRNPLFTMRYIESIRCFEKLWIMRCINVFPKTLTHWKPVNFIICSLNHYQKTVFFIYICFKICLFCNNFFFPPFQTPTLSVSFYRANERTYRLVNCMNHRYRRNRLKEKRINKLIFAKSVKRTLKIGRV